MTGVWVGGPASFTNFFSLNRHSPSSMPSKNPTGIAARIPEPLAVHRPASASTIRQLSETLALELPSQYQALLSEADGIEANHVQIYACSSVPERNATYEVSKDAPGYFLIGCVNDFPVLLRAGSESAVYQGGWGYLHPSYFVALAPSLLHWIDMGCPDRGDLTD